MTAPATPDALALANTLFCLLRAWRDAGHGALADRVQPLATALWIVGRHGLDGAADMQARAEARR